MNLINESHICYVNLDHRFDRLKFMLEALDKVNLKAQRVRGMLPTEYKGDLARVRVMQNRTPGAIGCHFSQVRIMEEALRLKKHAWVMEDDLIFCQDFHARLAWMELFISTHPWDILWLGGTFHVNPPWWHKEGLGRDAELTDDPRMIRTYGAFCTYAYIVRRESVDIVLRGLDYWLDKSMGIDWAMIQMQPELYTYAFVPGCIIQRDNKSDIGKGMTIFSGFAKLGRHWWADRMKDFDPTTYDWAEANPSPTVKIPRIDQLGMKRKL
jgi:GR25 family glycosyltransferase involved in LPS biosynthesis